MVTRLIFVALICSFIIFLSTGDSLLIHASLVNNSVAIAMIDVLPIPLPRLIHMADLVIIGTITEVSEINLSLHIEDTLIGTYDSKTIQIEQFIPTVFDGPRPSPYLKDQKFVYFLAKSIQKNEESKWIVIGLGGEGEMPAQGSYVYFEGSNVDGLERNSYDVHGVKRNLQRFNLNEFIHAVKNYPHCFSWTLNEENKKKRWIPAIHCSDTTLKSYKAKSWIHGYLVQKTMNKIPER